MLPPSSAQLSQVAVNLRKCYNFGVHPGAYILASTQCAGGAYLARDLHLLGILLDPGCGDCWLPKRFKLADEEGEEPGYGGAQDISEITTVTAVSGSLSLMHASISSQRLCNAL